MKRSDLEHVLRASRTITGETEFIVIGSQSILGSFPDAPRELRQSMEIDLYPKLRPELASLIEGSLGRHSPFDETFGYYADDNGKLELTDAVYALSFLFLGDLAPPAPLGECGLDPTADKLGCEGFGAC